MSSKSTELYRFKVGSFFDTQCISFHQRKSGRGGCLTVNK